MDSDSNNNPGSFPFSDDFLPIFMFFFHLNDPDQGHLNNYDDAPELELVVCQGYKFDMA